MRLFSEKVKPTFTSSDLNILTVKSSEEVFFDVYEFEINGKKFTAEKVANHNSKPVVDIPVVIGEEEFVAPFVLEQGEFSVQFNKNNKRYIGSTVVDIKQPIVSILEEDVIIPSIDVSTSLKDITFEEGKKSSKMIFDQKVDVFVSNIDHNILIVEDYDEVYFDIFEIEVNGKKYNTEKISTYKGHPVVKIPIVFENKEYVAPFVLEKGKQEVFFNENNLEFIKHIKSEELKLPVIEEEVVEEIVIEKKEDILHDINRARKLAKEYAEDIKRKKINEANSIIESNEKKLENYLEIVKEELTDEFLTIVDKTNTNLTESSQTKAKDLTKYIKGFVKKESTKLLDNLEILNENSVQHFELKIQELVKNIYTDNLTKLINEKSDKNVSQYSKLFEDTKTSLEHLLSKNKSDISSSLDSFKSEIGTDLTALEKSNVVLEDKLERGLNKALSRAGNARASALKEVDDRIKVTESKITDIYEVTLNEVNEQLEKRVQDVSYIEEKLEKLTNISNNFSSSTQESIKDVKSDIVKLKQEKELLEEKITESRSLLDRGIQKLNKLNKDIAKENKIYIKEEVGKLTEYNKKSSEQAASKLAKFNKNVAKRLQETKQYIDKEIDGFDSSINKLKKSNTESSKKSIEKIAAFKEDIATQLQEAKDHIHKEVQELDVSIVNLEKTNTEINSKISKAEEAVRKDFFDSIDNTEQVLTSLVESRLADTNEEINKLLTKKLKTVDNKFREQLTSKIEESKNMLSNEVRVLKESLPKTIESKVQFDKLPDKNEKIDIEGIRRELESKISSRFTQEISTIRRYLDTYGGGGGSVAMQFADGGTMRGDLTVAGTISARDGFEGGGNTEVFEKAGLSDYAVLDTFTTSDMTSGKYSIQVQNSGSYGGTYFSEVNITTDGINIGIVEYGINYTTDDPFVEYGAIVDSNIVSLTAKAINSSSMINNTFKGNRINLF